MFKVTPDQFVNIINGFSKLIYFYNPISDRNFGTISSHYMRRPCNLLVDDENYKDDDLFLILCSKYFKRPIVQSDIDNRYVIYGDELDIEFFIHTNETLTDYSSPYQNTNVFSDTKIPLFKGEKSYLRLLIDLSELQGLSSDNEEDEESFKRFCDACLGEIIFFITDDSDDEYNEFAMILNYLFDCLFCGEGDLKETSEYYDIIKGMEEKIFDECVNTSNKSYMELKNSYKLSDIIYSGYREMVYQINGYTEEDE